MSRESPVRWRWLALNLLMAAFYLALAGSSISAFHLAPAVWPPTAIGVLAAMLWGWSALPGVGLGALLANLLMLHWPPALAAWGALGGCLAPLVAVRGMGPVRATRPELWEQPLTVSTFLFWMGPAQAAVSALFGSVGLLAAGMIAPSQFWSVLVDSAIGAACAALMLVPMVHQLLMRRQHGRLRDAYGNALEAAGVVVVSVLLWALVFLAPGMTPSVRLGLLGLLLLPSIWSIFRLEPVVTSGLLALAYVLAVGATIRQLGPFAQAPLNDATSGIQLLGITMSCSILLGCALQSQRRSAISELRRLNLELDWRAEERAQALVQQEHSFRVMIESLPVPAMVTTDSALVLYANPAACELVGEAHDALLGVPLDGRWCDADAGRQLFADARLQGRASGHELALRRGDGSLVWVLASLTAARIDGRDVLLFACKDISERVEREQALRDQADTDVLTGLNNRRHFMATASRALRDLPDGATAAMLLIDLDDFKQINDHWGHECGDVVLRQTAAWLQSQVRPGELLARLGGEEFVMLIPGADARTARRHGDLLRLGLDGRVVQGAEGQRVPQPTLSIGVALAHPEADADVEALLAALLREADVALYDAKARGKNQVVVSETALRSGGAEGASIPVTQTPPEPTGHVPLHLLRELFREAEIPRFFEKIADAAAHLVGADGVAFVERDGDALQYRFSTGWPPGVLRSGERIPLGQGSVARALRENRVIFNPDYAGCGDALPRLVACGLRGNLLLPVGDAVRPQGALVLNWFTAKPPGELSAAQRDQIGLLADLMTAVLRREAIERELRQQGLRDAATRFPNQPALDLHLEHALARARRAEERLALVLIDLGAGPQSEGDSRRQTVAALRRAVRLADFFGCVGDGVFAVVLEKIGSDTDFDAALHRLLDAAGPRARLGYALYPDQAHQPASLQRLARQALENGIGTTVA